MRPSVPLQSLPGRFLNTIPRKRGHTRLGNYIIKPQQKGPKASRPESSLSVVLGARPPKWVDFAWGGHVNAKFLLLRPMLPLYFWASVLEHHTLPVCVEGVAYSEISEISTTRQHYENSGHTPSYDPLQTAYFHHASSYYDSRAFVI